MFEFLILTTSNNQIAQSQVIQTVHVPFFTCVLNPLTVTMFQLLFFPFLNHVSGHLYEIKGTICFGSTRKQNPNMTNLYTPCIHTKQNIFFSDFFSNIFTCFVCIQRVHTFFHVLKKKSHQNPQQHVFTETELTHWRNVRSCCQNKNR